MLFLFHFQGWEWTFLKLNIPVLVADLQSLALSILTHAHSNRYVRQDGKHVSRLWEIQV